MSDVDVVKPKEFYDLIRKKDDAAKIALLAGVRGEKSKRSLRIFRKLLSDPVPIVRFYACLFSPYTNDIQYVTQLLKIRAEDDSVIVKNAADQVLKKLIESVDSQLRGYIEEELDHIYTIEKLSNDVSQRLSPLYLTREQIWWNFFGELDSWGGLASAGDISEVFLEYPKFMNSSRYNLNFNSWFEHDFSVYDSHGYSEDNHNLGLSDLSNEEHFTDDIFERANKTELKEILDEFLGGLAERERKLLIMRFGLEDDTPRTLEDVGQEFNVTRERVRQIEAKALKKLRHPLRILKLKGYIENQTINLNAIEIRILQLLHRYNYCNHEISVALALNHGTLRRYVTSVRQKFGTSSIRDAVYRALEIKLISANSELHLRRQLKSYEIDILNCIVFGVHTDAQIAIHLCMSEHQVVQNIYEINQLFVVSNRYDAANEAIQRKIVKGDFIRWKSLHLTEQDLKILSLISQGKHTNAEIAHELNYSENTISRAIPNICRTKLDVADRYEAAAVGRLLKLY